MEVMWPVLGAISREGASVCRAWKQDVCPRGMALSTLYRLMRVIVRWIHQAKDDLQSWVAYTERNMRLSRPLEAIEAWFRVPERYRAIAASVRMIERLKAARSLRDEPQLSATALLHYLAEHAWSSLIGH